MLGAPLRLCLCLLIWASMPGTHLDELVSCPLFVAALIFLFGQPGGSLRWTCPGHLYALNSCSLAPFLPAGGCRDVNLPSISGFLPRRLPVCAMPGWCAELEVPKLWRARQPLVCRRGCPWGVRGQCAPSGQTIPVSSRLGCGAGVGGVAARGGANGGRC